MRCDVAFGLRGAEVECSADAKLRAPTSRLSGMYCIVYNTAYRKLIRLIVTSAASLKLLMPQGIVMQVAVFRAHCGGISEPV